MTSKTKSLLISVILLLVLAGFSTDALADPPPSDGSLIWHTYQGGSTTAQGANWDHAMGAAMDAAGNVYVVGHSVGPWDVPLDPLNPVNPHTPMADHLATVTNQDVFVAKFAADGTLIWHTFLGAQIDWWGYYLGETGMDEGLGIAVDTTGGVFVVGMSTHTWGAPIVGHGGHQFNKEAFLAKLNATSGALVWNTFMGGGAWNQDTAYGVDVDAAGNIFVTGISQVSWGAPVRSHFGGYGGDAFIAKFDGAGNRLWNTFLGGTNYDIGYDIALDAAGNIFVVGASAYGDPASCPPLQLGVAWCETTALQLKSGMLGGGDAFVARLDSLGQLVWYGFHGGDTHPIHLYDYDDGYGVDVDNKGHVIITGVSWTPWAAPTTVSPHVGWGDDAFVAKIDANSGTLLINTFMGESGHDIVVDDYGHVFVGGVSAYGYLSYEDAFACKLDNNLGQEWCRHLFSDADGFACGGNDYGQGLVVGADDSVYLAGYSDLQCDDPEPLNDHSDVTKGADVLLARLYAGATDANSIGMIIDNISGEAHIFDPVTDTVTAVVNFPPNAEGDCAITPDGSLGFATNFTGAVQVIDLTTSPPSHDGAIPISNPGEDLSITPDGQYLVVADGSAPAPLSVVDIATRTQIGTSNLSGASHTSVDVCSDGTVLATSSTFPGLLTGSIDGAGVITPGGSEPIVPFTNSLCVPGNATALGLSYLNGLFSFTLPGPWNFDYSPVETIHTSMEINAAGTRVFVRGHQFVHAYVYNPASGGIGTKLWATHVGPSENYFYGMDQLRLSPGGSKLYVGNVAGPALILDPETGAMLGNVTENIAPMTEPTGICFGGRFEADLENTAPVADAGPDQTLECGGPTTTVQLDGSGSYDPDPEDYIAAYLWTGGVFSPSDDVADPTVNLGPGVHGFDLTVTDTFGLTDSDSVFITVEDTTDPVIVAPTDISVQHTAHPHHVADLGTPVVTEACGYTVSNDAPSGNLFPLGVTIVTWTVTDTAGNSHSDTQAVEILNAAPVAGSQSPSFAEDSIANVITLAASDENGDSPLSFALVGGSGPDHGTLGGTAPNLTYTPDADYFGPDEFQFTATDEHGATSDPATVSITVTPVNDVPTISISRATATLQYSDTIGTVTITASDVDDSSLTISTSFTDSTPAPIGTDLPFDLGYTGSCTPDAEVPAGTGTNCSWDLVGQMLENAGTYVITFTVTDAGGGTATILSASDDTELIVEPEDASVVFEGANLVAIEVESPGGASKPFSLTVYVNETVEDLATFNPPMPGDLNNAVVEFKLNPVGPGSSVGPSGACTVVHNGLADYDQVLTVTCPFSAVPVNTYSVDVTVKGGYYTGFNDDVFTVYDPSLGFTTGGGWFYWPGTDQRTNFGYTMKYNKKRTNIQGSLLVIRHIPGAPEGFDKWRIKSNALEGLSIGEAGDPVFGWASFSGRATYKAPGEENEGNHEFTVYVEDHGEPGTGVDQFWLETRDKKDDVIEVMSMMFPGAGNSETLDGGNIFVPHQQGGKGKR